MDRARWHDTADLPTALPTPSAPHSARCLQPPRQLRAMSDPLEDLILEQLTALSLSTEPDTVEFVKGIVEEDTIEAEVGSSGPNPGCRRSER